jgi:5-methylcytosine-specific restriction protein A
VERGEGFCPIHKKEHHKRIDQDRPSAFQRGYDSHWRAYTKVYLAEHPLCIQCESEEGRVEPSTVVDHIKDHNGDFTLFWNPNNHQALCKRHHDSKTAREHLVKKN